MPFVARTQNYARLRIGYELHLNDNAMKGGRLITERFYAIAAMRDMTDSNVDKTFPDTIRVFD